MYNFFTKRLFFFIAIILLSFKYSDAQTITIDSVAAGPYGAGSTIAVHITVTGTCVTTSTYYDLYLSDANGSFAAHTKIGTFGGFYTTFVNGVIPAGTPAGTGYVVQVYSVNPQVASTISAPFQINASNGVVAGVSSQTLYPEIFGSCIGVAGTGYSFVNTSSAGTTVTASFFNEITQANEAIITPTAVGALFTANAAHYTVTVKAVSGGIVGTKCYFLLNNSMGTNFGASGSNTVCLQGGSGLLSYIISPASIKNNFPGLIYNVNWGDGLSDNYTYCQLAATTGIVSHSYTTQSCGISVANYKNTFQVLAQPENPYCGANLVSPISAGAQVVTEPKNIITPPTTPATWCANTPVTFINGSDPGQDLASNLLGCRAPGALYTWMVDGVVQATGYPLAQNFVNTFTSTGNHTVTLHLQNPGGACSPPDTTINICIQNPPVPAFSVPAHQGCIPFQFSPTNTSSIDPICNTNNFYLWKTTGPGLTYGNGTNQNSTQPNFVFTRPGTYTIFLAINASCGQITSANVETVVVDSIVTAQLSPDTILCGGNHTLSFNTTPSVTQTFLLGNGQINANTFQWTVSGGNYTFANGSTANSQYPDINFTDTAKYTVTVTNTSICGNSATATQHITFKQAPFVSAGNDSTVCSNQPIGLKGIANGTVTSTVWDGGSGTFTPGRSTLSPTYTPSAAEIKTGFVRLSLVASTMLAAPCNTISSSINLTLTHPDSITSATTQNSCSGQPINYQITSVVKFSSFIFTINKAKTSPSISGYSVTGVGTTINDVLVNSDPNNSADAVYDIVAQGTNGCSSNSFELTVTVSPQQSVPKFTQDKTFGCDSVKVQFTNTSTPINSVFDWNFGDGTPHSSSVNPSHTFAPRSDGRDTTYNIILSINSQCTNPIPFTSQVTVKPKTPVAGIYAESQLGCAPFNLVVHNTSPPFSASYDYYLYLNGTAVQHFRKTDTSTVKFSPILIPGLYFLDMVDTGYCNNGGKIQAAIPITVSPQSLFANTFPQNNFSTGCVPLSVNFINNSSGGDLYNYTIYDANNVAIDERPASLLPLPYTFSTAGVYHVTITASNSCSTAISPPVYYYANPNPQAQFSADTTSGCKDAKITFTNLTDDPTGSLSYEWDFGDGTPPSYLRQPPPHNYHYTNSPFTVKLIVTNSANTCTDTLKKVAYVTITAPPITQFTEKPDSISNIPNYHFSFVDQTTGTVTAWNWSFGDGSPSSTFQYPEHTYADTGKYKVTLTTTSKSGCDSTISHYVSITGVPGQLYLPNAFEPGGETIELRTFTAKGSGIKSWHMQIFNNYSQLVWETTKLDGKGAPVDGWDGTFQGSPAPQGVYVWQITATFLNGTEWKGNVIKNSPPKRTGTVNLIR